MAIRLDKLLSECGVASRTESAKAARGGQITVNGIPVKKADVKVEPDTDVICYCGRIVRYRKYVYVLLNKPAGYVSATDDGKDPVVTSLLPEEYRKMGVFPCGRLDKNTVGLMLLTNDGPLSHRLLAPKSHVAKKYRFQVKFPLSKEDCRQMSQGIDIGDYVTKPCEIQLEGEREGTITLVEGKYHQIKRMMEAVHNQIVFLERITFGPLTLDGLTERGDWRELTDDEISLLTSQNQE